MEWTDASTSVGTTTSTTNTCAHCGAFVTAEFVRVFGNNNGKVHGCLDCGTARDLREGNHITE